MIISDLIIKFKNKLNQLGYNSGVFGLVNYVEKDDKITPYIGEQKIIFDDNFDIQIYFKEGTKSTSNDYSQGFGDDFEINKTENYSLICYSKSVCESTIINIFNSIFMKRYTNIEVKELGYLEIVLNETGYSNDLEQIYAQELGNSSKKINIQDVLVQFDFEVITKKDSNCKVTLCQ